MANFGIKLASYYPRSRKQSHRFNDSFAEMSNRQIFKSQNKKPGNDNVKRSRHHPRAYGEQEMGLPGRWVGAKLLCP